jgi:TolA-binding protein
MPRPDGSTVDTPKEAKPPPTAPKRPAPSTPERVRTWRGSWQLPGLALASALFIGGVAAAVLFQPSPDFTGYLGEAHELVEHEEYRPALELLNSKVRPYLDAGQLPKSMRPEFHVLRARAIYLGQKASGIDLPVNHENVVSEYLAAERSEHALEPRDLYFLADTYVSLDRLDRAADRLERLPGEERVRRGQLLRRMIEKRMDAPSPDVVATLSLLTEFSKDAELGVSDRAWALARQSELLVRQGYADETIAKLLRAIPGMMEADPAQLGELYALLGRAYLDRNAVGEAARALEQAARLLPEQDTRRGVALVMLARIEAASRDGLEEARHKFAAVAEVYAQTPARLPALLGLAEAEAALGSHGEAAGAYGLLVGTIVAGMKHPEVTPEVVSKSLLDRYEDRCTSDDTVAALRYASLAQQLYPANQTPSGVLLALAQANRKAAEELLAEVGKHSRLVDLGRLDPATREQARTHLVDAGEFYRRYAGEVIDTDNVAYGRALWLAAESFDMAGDQDSAIPLFADYAKGFPGDPRQGEATFRLAQAQHSRGDLETAGRLYRSLIDGEAGTPGPFTDASYVPLARVLLDDAVPENDQEARELLEVVVGGQVGGIESTPFHDALIQLADLHYRAGDYASAIARLQEAVTRYPDDPQLNAWRYTLADANRLDADAIRRSCEQPMPDDQKRALGQVRLERLRAAMALFDQVRASLEGQDARRMSDLARLELRNATFYVADCAFELGQYDEAIRRYDAARERYPRDPASLVAMVQIVNSYIAQGDVRRAATANERARRFYESLPEEAWSDPTLPMGRRDWERWLDSLAQLTPIAGEGGADVPKKTTAEAQEAHEGP